MTKKHFIMLADMIRKHNGKNAYTPFSSDQISALADFCRSQNYNFKGQRWLDYIAGRCGKNGGKIRKEAFVT